MLMPDLDQICNLCIGCSWRGESVCISVMFIYAHVHGMFTIKFALDVHIYEAEWRHTALHQPTLGLNTLSASSRPTQIYKLCILSVQTSMNKLDFSLNSSSPNDDDQIPPKERISFFKLACSSSQSSVVHWRWSLAIRLGVRVMMDLNLGRQVSSHVTMGTLVSVILMWPDNWDRGLHVATWAFWACNHCTVWGSRFHYVGDTTSILGIPQGYLAAEATVGEISHLKSIPLGELGLLPSLILDLAWIQTHINFILLDYHILQQGFSSVA